VGNVTVQVMHTPGHTPDSMCLTVTDKRRSAEPWFVLTGDTCLWAASVVPIWQARARSGRSSCLTPACEADVAAGFCRGVSPATLQAARCGAGISGKPYFNNRYEKRSIRGSRSPTRLNLCNSFCPIFRRRPAEDGTQS